MRYFIGLCVITGIIYAGHKLERLREISAPFRSLCFFKLHYLILGMIIVPFFPDHFSHLFEQNRGPLVMFCLSWIGMYYGCGLELRAHQEFPKKILILNIIEPLIIFTLVSLVVSLVLYGVYGGWHLTRLAVVIALFSSFSIFRRKGILVREGNSKHHPTLDNMLPVGNFAPIALLCVVGVLLFGANSVTIMGHTFTGLLSLCMLNITFGGVMGALVNMMIAKADSPRAISIILIGGSALSGGIAYILSFSPLFVGAISGAFLINATLKRLQTLSALNDTNESVERIFMFILGTMVSPILPLLGTGIFMVLLSALGIFVLRSSIKFLFSSVWTTQFQEDKKGMTLLWIGLTGQGILATGAAFECSLFVDLFPAVMLLFVTLLVGNQLAIGIYVWLQERKKVLRNG